jgi:hypothetical protein
LNWSRINLLPASPVNLLNEASTSQYYTARNTSASYVRVDYQGHKQYERFLCLQAVGHFDLPLAVTINQEEYALTQSGPAPVPFALIIENVDDQLGYQMTPLKETGRTVIPRPERKANADIVLASLRKVLLQQGLFPDEAAAAASGVRQAWFGPGARVIYFLPRKLVDTMLSLQLTPAPTEHKRVYAVCVELITPAMRRACMEKLAIMNMEDTHSCTQFLNSSPLVRPILAQLLAELPAQATGQVPDPSAGQTMRQKITRLLQSPLAQRQASDRGL